MPAYDALDLTDNEFEPLNKDVVITDMTFDERRTQSGIILRNDNGTGLGIRPRWGRVYAVGENQHEVKVGDWVCVAHGRWTRGVAIVDETGERIVRKIDPNDILLISDSLPEDETMSTAEHVDQKER